MPDEGAIKRKAVTAAALLLVELLGESPPESPVEATVSDGAVEVRVLVIRPQPGANGQAPGRQEAGNGRAGTGQVSGEVAEAIRAVLGRSPKPLKIISIAAKARREPTNYFRDTVRRMVAGGELLHLPGHVYWPATRPLPAGQDQAGSGW